MQEDRDVRNRSDAYGQFKASRDVAMGVIYILISVMAVQTDYIVESYGKTVVWSFAVLFSLYGLFRAYRGINYYFRK